MKSPYSFSSSHPNAVIGSLMAIIARWQIPVIFAYDQTLAEEMTASLLHKFSALEYQESHGFPRYFIEGDI